MKTKKSKKTYGRGSNITRTRELAKELRDGIKETIASWAARAGTILREQGYDEKVIEAALSKITDEAYDGLAWKVLHKGEGYKDPYHERQLQEFLAEHPDGWAEEKRVGYRRFVGHVFKEADIKASFSEEVEPLFGPKE